MYQCYGRVYWMRGEKRKPSIPPASFRGVCIKTWNRKHVFLSIRQRPEITLCASTRVTGLRERGRETTCGFCRPSAARRTRAGTLRLLSACCRYQKFKKRNSLVQQRSWLLQQCLTACASTAKPNSSSKAFKVCPPEFLVQFPTTWE